MFLSVLWWQYKYRSANSVCVCVCARVYACVTQVLAELWRWARLRLQLPLCLPFNSHPQLTCFWRVCSPVIKCFCNILYFAAVGMRWWGVDDGGPNINLNFLLRICWLLKGKSSCRKHWTLVIPKERAFDYFWFLSLCDKYARLSGIF